MCLGQPDDDDDFDDVFYGDFYDDYGCLDLFSYNCDCDGDGYVL